MVEPAAADREGGAPAMYVVRTLRAEAEIRSSQKLRGQIFGREKGFVPATRLAADGAESDEFDERSVHGGVFALDGDLVGSIRLIPADLYVLPITTHYGVEAGPDDVEVSRLVVHASVRRSVVTMALFHWVVWESITREASRLFAILEEALLANLRTVGFPFVVLGDRKEIYPNSVDLPVVCAVPDLLSGVERADDRRHVKLHDFFAHRLEDGLLPSGVLPSDG